MLSEADIEKITAFCRVYCSVETSEDDDETPDPDRFAGRFSLCQGPRVGNCKVVGTLLWGPFERTAPELLRRVRALCENGEGNVFIKAYRTGNSNPEEYIRIQAIAELSDSDDGPADNSAVSALAHALVVTNKELRLDNRDMRGQLMQLAQTRIEEFGQFTMLVQQVKLLEDNRDSSNGAAVVEALGPIIEKMTPAMMEMLQRAMAASGGASTSPLPTDPLERLNELIKRVFMQATQFGAECQGAAKSDPTLLQRMDKKPLYELVKYLSGPLGITVTYPEGV